MRGIWSLPRAKIKGGERRILLLQLPFLSDQLIGEVEERQASLRERRLARGKGVAATGRLDPMGRAGPGHDFLFFGLSIM